MAAKQPVAIVFDTFGTVVDWRGSLIAELTEFGRQRGINADWTGAGGCMARGLSPLNGPGAQGRTTLDDAGRPASHVARQTCDPVRNFRPDRGRPAAHQPRLAPAEAVAGFGAGPDTPEAPLHHRAIVERQCVAPDQYGEVRRHSLGHGVRLRPVRSFQARSGDLSRRCPIARSGTRPGDAGRGA